MKNYFGIILIICVFAINFAQGANSRDFAPWRKRIRRNLYSLLNEKNSKSNEPENVIQLLLEIKDLLTLGNKDEPSEWRQEFEAFQNEMNSSVKRLNDQIDNLSKSSNQKVDILLQTLSAIGVQVTSEFKDLEDLRARLQRAEERIFNLENEDAGTKTREKVPKVPNSSTDPINSHFIIDSLSASIPESPHITPLDKTDSTNSGSRKSENTSGEGGSPSSVDSLRETLKEVESDILNLKVNLTSQSTVITGLKNQNKIYGELIPKINGTYRSCSCNTESFNNSIQEVNEEVQLLKLQYRALLSTNNDSLERLTNFVDKLRLENEITKNTFISLEPLLSDLKRFRSEFPDDSFRFNSLEDQIESISLSLSSSINRISEVESRLQANETVFNKGLCVWPYEKNAGSCFFISKDKRMKWVEARSHCKGIQGDLAAPKDFKKFRQFLSSQKLSRSYSYWIGGSDLEKDDQWQWVDGTPIPMGAEIWASDQPNEGKSANCMSLKLSSRVIAASDEECSSSNYFICEQE